MEATSGGGYSLLAELVRETSTPFLFPSSPKRSSNGERESRGELLFTDVVSSPTSVLMSKFSRQSIRVADCILL